MDRNAQKAASSADPARDLASLLTIGEVSRRYGLTLRALRFYEDRGMVRPLRHGAARFYDADACRRIEMILRGKSLGYTLSTINRMLTQTAAHGQPRFDVGTGEVEAQIARLERKRRKLDVVLTELRAAHGQLASASEKQPGEA